MLIASSPIGLGHIRRDVAIAEALRQLHPDIEVDWLAQHPVTAVLESLGEAVHPASRLLANESGHFESESAEHDLHCFSAWRRMDEILLANFMVFDEVVRDRHYDLWVGDEAWEIDYYLHENPELKRSPYAWLTDFVGWLPMPDGGETKPRSPPTTTPRCSSRSPATQLRDRSVFVGDRPMWWPTASDPAYRESGSGQKTTSASPATSQVSIRLSLSTATLFATSSAGGRGEGLSSHRRRDRRRRVTARTSGPVVSCRRATGPRAAHDRGDGSTHRQGLADVPPE